MPKCNRCGSEMTYYEPAKDWYCYTCNAYSRLNMPYSVPVDSVSKRSILRVMALIIGILGIISVSILFFGLGQMNEALRISPNEYGGYYYDYNDMTFDEYRSDMLLKGAMNVAIAVILLMVSYVGIHSTLSKREWWERMHRHIDTAGNDPWANVMIKTQLVAIFQVYYGALILCGVVFLGVGIYFLNQFQSGGLYALAVCEAALGALLMLLSYVLYGKEMMHLSKDVYPMLGATPSGTPDESSPRP